MFRFKMYFKMYFNLCALISLNNNLVMITLQDINLDAIFFSDDS